MKRHTETHRRRDTKTKRHKDEETHRNTKTKRHKDEEGETLEIEGLDHVLLVVQGLGFSVRVYLHVVAVR